jgi:hypothetical protein
VHAGFRAIKFTECNPKSVAIRWISPFAHDVENPIHDCCSSSLSSSSGSKRRQQQQAAAAAASKQQQQQAARAGVDDDEVRAGAATCGSFLLPKNSSKRRWNS